MHIYLTFGPNASHYVWDDLFSSFFPLHNVMYLLLLISRPPISHFLLVLLVVLEIFSAAGQIPFKKCIS